VLANRAAGAAHRPWLDVDPRAWVERALEVREQLYAEVADLTVDTSRGTPSRTAADIQRALTERALA
jgi:shikimate kinase